jgi:hypothetical protein
MTLGNMRQQGVHQRLMPARQVQQVRWQAGRRAAKLEGAAGQADEAASLWVEHGGYL